MVGIFREYVAHAGILAAVIVVTLAVRVALKEQYIEERRDLEAKAHSRRSREIVAGWNRLIYTGATFATFPNSFMSKVDWTSLELSELQRAKLEVRMKELLVYLQSPSFHAYYRLKTEGLHYRFQLDDRASNILRKTKFKTEDMYKPSPMQLANALWETIRAQSKDAELAKLTAVCLDHISTATSSTNSLDAVLFGKVAKGFTVAKTAIDPGFQYETTEAQDGSRTYPRWLAFHVSFFAHSNVSNDAGPIHIALFWSDSDGNWVLSRMFTDIVLQMDILF